LATEKDRVKSDEKQIYLSSFYRFRMN